MGDTSQSPGPHQHCEPKLGCATTQQLLQELSARGRLGRYDGNYEMAFELEAGADRLIRLLPRVMLDYRTVD